MEQRITVLSIAADDLPAMRNFYENTLGWQPWLLIMTWCFIR